MASLLRFYRLRFRVPALACAALIACGNGSGDEHTTHCPPPNELMAPTHFFTADGSRIDSNGDPDDFESDTFVDRNHDGRFDTADAFDHDGDGVPDDFNEDGLPDNRFYFNDRAAWLPDADSFDDYENPELGIPRGVTPVPGDCPADGIATGPLDLIGGNNQMFADWWPSRCCRRPDASDE